MKRNSTAKEERNLQLNQAGDGYSIPKAIL